jgi:hypothetical protein
VIVYVVDTVRCRNAVTFMSNMLYACSILYKLKLCAPAAPRSHPRRPLIGRSGTSSRRQLTRAATNKESAAAAPRG